jgi:hypothetical protein
MKREGNGGGRKRGDGYMDMTATEGNKCGIVLCVF